MEDQDAGAAHAPEFHAFAERRVIADVADKVAGASEHRLERVWLLRGTDAAISHDAHVMHGAIGLKAVVAGGEHIVADDVDGEAAAIGVGRAVGADVEAIEEIAGAIVFDHVPLARHLHGVVGAHVLNQAAVGSGFRLDEAVAMVAVGLWGAQLGMPALWVLPVAFPMMMAFGGMLGLIGVPLPGVEIGIAVSAVVLGVLVLGQVRLPLPAAVAVVAFFAVFHGHAHGTELEPGQNAMLYSLGFVIATGLLHATGIAIGLVNRWEPGRQALRLAGALVMAGGLYFLWGAVA